MGIEIMSHRETHGGQVREEDWRANLAERHWPTCCGWAGRAQYQRCHTVLSQCRRWGEAPAGAARNGADA